VAAATEYDYEYERQPVVLVLGAVPTPHIDTPHPLNVVCPQYVGTPGTDRRVTEKKPTDDDLMARIACDNQDAFAQLVGKYQKQLLNFFVRMGAHMDEAEDLAQETFLRLHAYRRKYEASSRFTSFLFVLARHARADMLRKSKRSTEIGTENLDLAEDGSTPHDARTEAKLDVTQALATLSEKLRPVVVLAVFQGLDYQQIAEILEIPLGTVKSRMHLAMRALREALDVGDSD
jgi:RNA polymerase sigma-70 factor (ECF subfamily)